MDGLFIFTNYIEKETKLFPRQSKHNEKKKKPVCVKNMLLSNSVWSVCLHWREQLPATLLLHRDLDIGSAAHASTEEYSSMDDVSGMQFEDGSVKSRHACKRMHSCACNVQGLVVILSAIFS